MASLTSSVIALIVKLLAWVRHHYRQLNAKLCVALMVIGDGASLLVEVAGQQ